MAARGRPTTYTQKAAEEICERLSKGEPLASICRDEHMPAVRTVSDWKKAHEAFAADFARAREDGFDALAAECLAIADCTAHDTVLVGPEDAPREAANTEWISRSKLRVETRLKLLAKWDPKRYGERLTTEISGPDGGPIQTIVDRPPNETREEWLERRNRELGHVGAAAGTAD
ncbi:hypothetical protein [Methylocaldum sp.]|uniref:terminase small subunit-like protein n=1 Tax=Methylocaldum sp. TaxID=1969727 RepID=UPI002D5324BA|nr:hypothetical protein [Methylocaldum sp.]HYE38215.1 hypothetical protein [Methylocaldum sp.]